MCITVYIAQLFPLLHLAGYVMIFSLLFGAESKSIEEKRSQCEEIAKTLCNLHRLKQDASNSK